MLIEDTEVTKLDAIVDCKRTCTRLLYKVKWISQSQCSFTWEIESAFRYNELLDKMLDEFYRKNVAKVEGLRDQARSERKKQQAKKKNNLIPKHLRKNKVLTEAIKSL